MDWSEFPTFRLLGNKSMSVNWNDSQSSIFFAKSPTELKLDPAFENHIRTLSNWTCGPELAVRFPFMNCVPKSRDEGNCAA
jgi:hypothetical protein